MLYVYLTECIFQPLLDISNLLLVYHEIILRGKERCGQDAELAIADNSSRTIFHTPWNTFFVSAQHSHCKTCYNSCSEQKHSPGVSRVPEHVVLLRGNLLLVVLLVAAVCFLLAGGGRRAADCRDEPNAEETHSDTVLAFIVHKKYFGRGNNK